MAEDRHYLGEWVSTWMKEQRARYVDKTTGATTFEVIEFEQTQSSDATFHMVAISIWYYTPVARR